MAKDTQHHFTITVASRSGVSRSEARRQVFETLQTSQDFIPMDISVEQQRKSRGESEMIHHITVERSQENGEITFKVSLVTDDCVYEACPKVKLPDQVVSALAGLIDSALINPQEMEFRATITTKKAWVPCLDEEDKRYFTLIEEST